VACSRRPRRMFGVTGANEGPPWFVVSLFKNLRETSPPFHCVYRAANDYSIPLVMLEIIPSDCGKEVTNGQKDGSMYWNAHEAERPRGGGLFYRGRRCQLAAERDHVTRRGVGQINQERRPFRGLYRGLTCLRVASHNDQDERGPARPMPHATEA
jgi:hypothetical protein